MACCSNTAQSLTVSAAFVGHGSAADVGFLVLYTS
jgi:hypothetical protein